MNNYKKYYRKTINFLERDLSIYIIQFFIFILIFWLLNQNYLFFLDIYARNKLMSLRNNYINQTLKLDPKFKNKITLIDLDESFFAREKISYQGIHRGYYAQVLQHINQYHPAVIGVDVFFENKFNFTGSDSRIKLLNNIFSSFDQELENGLTGSNILATAYDFKNKKIILPGLDFVKNTNNIGHIHSLALDNNINIGIHPSLQDISTHQIIYPLSIEVFKKYLLSESNFIDYSNNQSSLQISQTNNFLIINFNKETYQIPIVNLENQQFIMVPLYITRKEDLNIISFYDIYYNTKNYQNEIENKIVYIGATDLSLNDYKTTLAGYIPGVFIHINNTLALYNKDFLYILNNNQRIILIILIIFLNIIITSIYNFNKNINQYQIHFLLVGELILFVIIGIILASIHIGGYSIFLPMGSILAFISIQIVIILVYSLLTTGISKEIYAKLFNLYVGEKLVNKLEKNVDELEDMIAEEREVAIFFSDIAGYTNMSESLTPQENINFLNHYLKIMSDNINQNLGIIDKYIGDAIMAFWKQEDASFLAVKSAIHNIQFLPQVNQKIKDIINKNNCNNTVLDIRIGLHYGKVIIGDIGSAIKQNHTIIGDNVNLTSRLEGINKFYATRICASEDFIKQIQNYQEFLYRKLDKIKVKGKQKPILIYEIFPYMKSRISIQQIEDKLIFIRKFEESLADYFLGQFGSAREKFQNLADMYHDATSQIFLERCDTLIANPISEWDGIWTYTKKG